MSHSPPSGVMGDLNKPMDLNGFVISRTLLSGICKDSSSSWHWKDYLRRQIRGAGLTPNSNPAEAGLIRSYNTPLRYYVTAQSKLIRPELGSPVAFGLCRGRT
jgi:hypothetical protein